MAGIGSSPSPAQEELERCKICLDETVAKEGQRAFLYFVYKEWENLKQSPSENRESAAKIAEAKYLEELARELVEREQGRAYVADECSERAGNLKRAAEAIRAGDNPYSF